jgi:hypothetical protein
MNENNTFFRTKFSRLKNLKTQPEDDDQRNLNYKKSNQNFHHFSFLDGIKSINVRILPLISCIFHILSYSIIFYHI